MIKDGEYSATADAVQLRKVRDAVNHFMPVQFSEPGVNEYILLKNKT